MHIGSFQFQEIATTSAVFLASMQEAGTKHTPEKVYRMQRLPLPLLSQKTSLARVMRLVMARFGFWCVIRQRDHWGRLDDL